jgi:hypothetical protein
MAPTRVAILVAVTAAVAAILILLAYVLTRPAVVFDPPGPFVRFAVEAITWK